MMGFYYGAYKKMKNQTFNCKMNTDYEILETTTLKAHLWNKNLDKGKLGILRQCVELK